MSNADPLDHWHLRNAPPAGDPYAVAYGNNTFVATGYGGSIATSPDGAHWTLRETPVSNDFYGIAFGNGVFVAAAYYPGIISSVNGFDWGLQYTNVSGFEALAFAGGKFFAMGYRLAVSSDGTNWIAPNLSNSSYLSDVTFGKGVYVAVRGDEIATSYDGLSWALHSTPAADTLNSIAFGNNRFVAVGYYGEVIISSDGTNWTRVVTGIESDFHKISFFEGRFFATGYMLSEFVWTSEDGTTWTAHGPPKGSEFTGVASGGGTFVLVGQNDVARSEDALNWSTVFSEGDPWLHSIAYGEDLQVAVGWTPSAFVSSDGVVWRKVSAGTQANLDGVTYGDGRFVAVGWYGAIVTSTDGTNWIPVSSGTSDHLEKVAFGDGKFVCADGKYQDARVLISSNGLDWTSHTVGAYSLRGVAYGNGIFLVFGDDAALLTSTNGIEWVEQYVPSGRSEYYLDVAWGNGLFVLVGTYGRLFTSPDGVNWTGQSMGPLYTRGVAFVNGQFLVGSDDSPMFSSVDGFNWTRHESGSVLGLYHFVFAHGAVTALGGIGGIFQTDPWQTSAPEVRIPPPDMVLNPAAASSMEVVASGTSPLSYQWFHDATPITGATNSALYFYDLEGADGGEYWATVSNALGSSTSAPGILTIRPVLSASWNGVPELMITGTPGRTYRIEYANDLSRKTSWQFLTTITLTTPSQTFKQNGSSRGARFYRAALVSP